MSIIHDALKKTQKAMNQNPAGNTPEGEGKKPPQLNTENDRFIRPGSASGPAGLNPGLAARPSSQQKIAPGPQPPPKRPRKTGRLLFLIIFLTGLIGGGWYLFPPAAHPPGDTAASPQSGGLQLSGIMTMGEKRTALINNEIYEAGDIVDGMRIVEIERDKVHLSRDGKIVKVLKVFSR